jgi:hypothetical protein
MEPRPPKSLGAGFLFFAGRAAAASRLAAALLALGAGGMGTRLAAQPSVPNAETMEPPTAARLAQLEADARREGWAAQVPGLRDAARRAYQHDRLEASTAWFHVYRWAALFGRDEADFVSGWIRAVNTAQVGHANMPTRYRPRHEPLAHWLTPACQAWLIGHPEFSDAFFSLLQPVDFLPGVFQILSRLHQRDPAQFDTYNQLALALAVVYDVPPPSDWPHAQVSAAALPRHWPKPEDAFAWWTREEHLGHLYHRLTRLEADELKFVIDAAAPFNELGWSQQAVAVPLNQLPRAYRMVRYRRDRLSGRRMMWPGASYTLPAILEAGGICVDQAYFASEAGKARGVPTLLFCGAGRDGRHAWFGFLDGNQHWQLDAGRYAEQRFVTGLARDPQTWREISDHELKFLGERFRALPSFHQSQRHEEFAADYLASGDPAAAAVAARKAVNYERRNQPAWETLLAAEAASGREAKAREGTLREAMRAFQLYPDLETLYSNRLSASLRARGETSAADFEERRIARKYQTDRSDLSLRQAREILARSMATQPLAEQIRTYDSAVVTFGPGAGMGFYDRIVVMFVEHLEQYGRRADALRAAERARRTLHPEPGSQLDQEFSKLIAGLKGG